MNWISSQYFILHPIIEAINKGPMCWPLNQNMVIVLCTPTHLATIQTRERIMYAKLGFCHVNWCRRLSGTEAALVLSPDPFWCLGTRMRLIDFAFTNLTFHAERRVWSHCNWWIVPTLEYWCDQSDSCYSWIHQICHNTVRRCHWLAFLSDSSLQRDQTLHLYVKGTNQEKSWALLF